MAVCIATLKVCKAESERQDYEFNLTDEFAIHWKPNEYYDSFDVIRPTIELATGWEYTSTSSGGVSGTEEPNWPRTENGAVLDGSIEWVAIPISNSSLRHRILAVTWIADTGLTLADQIEEDLPGRQAIRIWVSGGTAGTVYNNVAEIETTLSDALYEVRLEVTIEQPA